VAGDVGAVAEGALLAEALEVLLAGLVEAPGRGGEGTREVREKRQIMTSGQGRL
jgi:hypothetical protein